MKGRRASARLAVLGAAAWGVAYQVCRFAAALLLTACALRVMRLAAEAAAADAAAVLAWEATTLVGGTLSSLWRGAAAPGGPQAASPQDAGAGLGAPTPLATAAGAVASLAGQAGARWAAQQAPAAATGLITLATGLLVSLWRRAGA